MEKIIGSLNHDSINRRIALQRACLYYVLLIILYVTNNILFGCAKKRYVVVFIDTIRFVLSATLYDSLRLSCDCRQSRGEEAFRARALP